MSRASLGDPLFLLTLYQRFKIFRQLRRSEIRCHSSGNASESWLVEKRGESYYAASQ